ncbi:hypothetical protein L7F22_014894 [Adiantum nelumboides]|nr:hypothetical protein [Adiantum nelumboides]
MAFSYPEFHGRKDEDIEDFLEKMEMACISNHVQAPPQMLCLLQICLKGDARAWSKSHEAELQMADPPIQVTWDILRKALTKNFVRLEDPDKVWHEIQGLKQQEAEPIDDYIKKFSLLWESLCEALQPQGAPPDMMKKDRFLAGLKENVRWRVELKKPRTYENTLEVARNKEWKIKRLTQLGVSSLPGVPKMKQANFVQSRGQEEVHHTHSSSDDERTDIDKEQDSEGSDKEEGSQKGAEAKGPSEHEPSDERTPLPLLTGKNDKTHDHGRGQEGQNGEGQGIARREETIEAEQKAQEEAVAADTTQAPKEKEVVDLTSHMEHLKKIQRDKNLEEQWAAQMAQEKIREALRRKTEEPILEPREGNPKKPRQEDEEELENIQADPLPPSPKFVPPDPPSSPKFIPLAPPSSPKSPIPPPPSPKSPLSSKSPSAPKSPPQQPPVEETHVPSKAPKATEVPKWSFKLNKKDDSAKGTIEEPQKEQGPRGVLESHPLGPSQERVQIHLPIGEILERRAQSPSFARPMLIPTLIIQTDPSQEVAYEFVRNFYYNQVLQNLAR